MAFSYEFGAKNISKIELEKWHFNTESYGLVVKVTPMLPYNFGPPAKYIVLLYSIFGTKREAYKLAKSRAEGEGSKTPSLSVTPRRLARLHSNLVCASDQLATTYFYTSKRRGASARAHPFSRSPKRLGGLRSFLFVARDPLDRSIRHKYEVGCICTCARAHRFSRSLKRLGGLRSNLVCG